MISEIELAPVTIKRIKQLESEGNFHFHIINDENGYATLKVNSRFIMSVAFSKIEDIIAAFIAGVRFAA